MSTIGERITETMEQRRARLLREAKWQRRKDTAIGIALVLVGLGIALGTLFAAVYLVVLAVRLAWGS